MLKKDRSRTVNKTCLLRMLPPAYQTHLQSQLQPAEYLLLTLLIKLLQSIKQVKLETLATALPLPILFESRRKKLQRFLSLPQLTIEKIWFPFFSAWLRTELKSQQVLHLAIDRTKWGCINLLIISLIWHKRALPVYWEILPKQGNSNFEKQTAAINRVLPLFKEYKVVILGDREFCSVKLGNWLREQHVYFCLRLKRNEFVQLEDEIWLQLSDLGLFPGVMFYLEGVKVTKPRGFAKFNIGCKWKRKYWGWVPDEGWFILTNLANLESAILAYKKRFGIEEMFRDFKKGGYNLEGTGVKDERLIVLVLLIAIAYTTATMQGKKVQRMGLQKYIGRLKETRRVERRHSSFYIGLYSETWVNFLSECTALIGELLRCSRNKFKYYQEGLRAMELILATL